MYTYKSERSVRNLGSQAGMALPSVDAARVPLLPPPSLNLTLSLVDRHRDGDRPRRRRRPGCQAPGLAASGRRRRGVSS